MLMVMSRSAQEEGAAAEDVPRGLLERRESVPFVLPPRLSSTTPAIGAALKALKHTNLT